MTWGHDKSKAESARDQDFMRSCYIMRISSRTCNNEVFVQVDANRISSVLLCLLHRQYTVHVIIHDHTSHAAPPL